ncbi:MAG TPA: hypothetical protein DDW73_17310 [Rhizobium sp.]|nr:hypothetical protein [Rhizobium sp.]
MVDARRYLISTAKITACYLPDIKQNNAHREDVARLEGLFLQELGALMSLVQEIETVPPPDFDQRAVLDPYVDKIKRDLDGIVADVAKSLEVRQSRSEEARLRLAIILVQEYPNLAPFLSSNTRAKVG